MSISYVNYTRKKSWMSRFSSDWTTYLFAFFIFIVTLQKNIIHLLGFFLKKQTKFELFRNVINLRKIRLKLVLQRLYIKWFLNVYLFKPSHHKSPHYNHWNSFNILHYTVQNKLLYRPMDMMRRFRFRHTVQWHLSVMGEMLAFLRLHTQYIR